MSVRKANTTKNFKTVDEVENTFNFKETVIEGGKLLTVEAVGQAAEHKTVGTYNETLGDPFGPGTWKFKLDNGGTNTAWINGVKIKISFSKDAG